MTVNDKSLGFGLLVREKKQFKDAILNSEEFWHTFLLIFNILQTEQLIVKIIRSWSPADNSKMSLTVNKLILAHEKSHTMPLPRAAIVQKGPLN